MITLSILILILSLLQAKHLFLDWILQPKWMWSNKGTYGHIGGISHAALNALGTSIIFYMFFGIFWIVFLIDFSLHYHIDYAKMKILDMYKYSPYNPEFWWLTGFDQFLHQMTYILLIWLVA